MARKYAKIFVRGHDLFRVANSELRGTDNVQGQISEPIFAPNGGYCLYYPGSYTIAAKPIKTLELHYTMIQFLINIYTPG